MTATDPTAAPAQPATSGQAPDFTRERAILRWAAQRIRDDYGDQEGDGVAEMMDVWADELDAAPAAPEHEPGVQPDWCGYMAGRAADALRQLGHTGLAEHVEHLERAHVNGNPEHLYAPLSTAPPAGTEAQ